jgi:zinc finger SWIM domain-containing protein 3
MKRDYDIKQVVDKTRQSSIAPKVGMAFEYEDNAYEMYNKYAGIIGFSIRKSTTKRRPDGTIYQKYIVCSGEGHGKPESLKGTTRTGCGARIQLVVSKEGIWTVKSVVLEQNHYLASPNKNKNLRSQRPISEADRKANWSDKGSWNEARPGV